VVEALRAVRRASRGGERSRLSGADPLNLIGLLTPGPRPPAVLAQRIEYVDGAPVPPTSGNLLLEKPDVEDDEGQAVAGA
jgi:ATP-dependent Lhr-like helicase